VTKNVFLEDKTIRLIMWDTAGSERFKSLIPTYLKNAHAIILTFDITNKTSFLSLPTWLKEIKDKIPENAYIIVAGNKLDMESKRQVTATEAKKFCEDNKLQYLETSASEGKNIKKLFETITVSLFDSQNFMTNKDKTVVLDQAYRATETKKKANCCSKN
jgi:small GTP-binding protein